MNTVERSGSFFWRVPVIAALLVSWLSIGGCAVKMVADYDAATFEETLRVGKAVDRFYGDLLEAPQEARPYADFADRYVEIEADLRSLYIRNKARALNEESAQISEIILNLWLKYKTNHAAKNSYHDGVAKLDRARFTRLFVSAANAEAAKKLEAGDKDTNKESQE